MLSSKSNSSASIFVVYGIFSVRKIIPFELHLPAIVKSITQIRTILFPSGIFLICLIFRLLNISISILIQLTLAINVIASSNSWIFQKCLSQFNFNSIDFQFSVYRDCKRWNAVYFFQFNQGNFIRLNADCCIWCYNFCSF